LKPNPVGSTSDLGNSGEDASNLSHGDQSLFHLLEGRWMPDRFDPKTDILPPAQHEIWPLLAPAPRLSFVLYGGTAVALHFGHRVSIDFDFFRAEPLNKQEIETSFQFMRAARTMQEDENTLVLSVPMPSGPVKVSMFGSIDIGRINEPLLTKDGTLLVASLEDLLATKLKAILDRAETKDYRDISEMLSANVSLERALAAFAQMYGKDPSLPLRAMGFFKDGDLPSLAKTDQDILRKARDRVLEIPEITLVPRSLAK
jgi:Nucleotidyl transferase AbiEii toxin, Type IV TA system